ncbi:tetratricopeptide repeat protein [Burkholderia pseudomultivorans]|uniref:O-linked N-acetylglucosamine transferase, SPINDLY family protein n=1 Tax=Burkholderia pseudomultivorans TaxID=1207504 RepID=UPI000755C19C|nr:glycosyltransferase family 41 protein [Burkholderia pseudomultivorans]KWF06919.1 hypothetical protein WT55_19565 [Burkholderia pseudomultivorans]
MNLDTVKQSMAGLVRTSLGAGLAAQISPFLTEDMLDTVADPDLYYLAGNLRLREQAYDRARTLYQKASRLAPAWGSPLNNIGVSLEREGKRDDAYPFYELAAERAPADRLIGRNAAYAAFHHKDRRFRAKAAKHLRTLLQHHAQDAELHSKLAYVYFYLGENDKALEHAKRSVQLNPRCVTGIVQKVSLRLPIVYRTESEIDEVRSEIARALDEMSEDVDRALRDGVPAVDELRDVWCDALFYLTYNGRANVDLLSRFNDQVGRLTEAMFADAQRKAAENRLARHTASSKPRIRIAFVSAFFNGHSIWKIPTIGYYENLDRSQFEVCTYHMGASHDRFTEDARRMSDMFFESTFVGDIVNRLAVDAPDVIVFPDVGMNFSSYCLTTLRMAPLQMQMLGHPDTSGSRNVDYVVTADLMETAEAQENYREKLVRLPGLGCTYSFSYPAAAPVGRAFFGLSEDDIVFVSPQSTFKYTPADDDLYPRIAARVGKRCKIVFFPRSDEASVRIFVERMKRAFERHGLSHDEYVRYVKGPLSQPEFVALCSMSDVFLDNPSWSGHNTTLDALHGGAVVVCTRGRFMRQMHAAALMQFLGFPELVAQDIDGMVDLCAQFASDEAFRSDFRARLASRLPMLADKSCIQVFEEFVTSECAQLVPQPAGRKRSAPRRKPKAETPVLEK